MEWRLLDEPALVEMYDRELGRDFPETELRPCAAAVQLMRQGYMRAWTVWDSGALCAYLFVLDSGSGPVLLDYFAVLPAWRGKGLGTALLQALSRRENRPLLIESEWPARAPDPALAVRRLGFYARCGAQPTPYYDRAFQGWFLVLLLAPATSDAPADAAALEAAGPALKALYRLVMPGPVFFENFEVGRLHT